MDWIFYLIKKDVFERLGGFQEGFRRASGEDNDLSYKILEAGYRIFFERQAIVGHYHTERLGKYLREQFSHGFWRVKLYAEHPAMIKGDDYTFWKDALEIPWSVGCVLIIVCWILQWMSFYSLIYYSFFVFLFFEIFFAGFMLKTIFESIYFGFVMFFRAFARTFGLSTGIFYFFALKMKKFLK